MLTHHKAIGATDDQVRQMTSSPKSGVVFSVSFGARVHGNIIVGHIYSLPWEKMRESINNSTSPTAREVPRGRYSIASTHRSVRQRGVVYDQAGIENVVQKVYCF